MDEDQDRDTQRAMATATATPTATWAVISGCKYGEWDISSRGTDVLILISIISPGYKYVDN